jgi:glucosyl-3-phosphoglycerate phosphatase
MLRVSTVLLVLALAAAPASAQQQSLGIFGQWGAFAGSGRCHAISEPYRTVRSGIRAFASVGYWPDRGVRGQVHFRLAAPKRPGSAVLLRIDEQTFQLRAGGVNAWAPDARADADIVAAMRTGIDMTIETRSERGALIRDSYWLRRRRHCLCGPAGMIGRLFIARHGETVFNAVGRIQGDAEHTPLTRAGFAQADAIGEALLAYLGPRPALTLWSSPSGRALQTLAVIAEHLELDWHEAKTDKRLAEIAVGDWSGRYYRDLAADGGTLIDTASGLFTRFAPDGERYDAVARRLESWIADQAGVQEDRLILMHGMSSRVLRGLLTGLSHRPGLGCPIADQLPQGSIVCIEGGVETVLHRAVPVSPGGGPAI